MSEPAREDIGWVLDDPRFWAMKLGHLFVDGDSRLEPEEKYFGCDAAALNSYYEEVFRSRSQRNVLPFIRVPIESTRHVEIDFTFDGEDEDQFWIGSAWESRRVMVGYYSGSFSLPAFRLEEVRWLTRLLPVAQARCASLLLSACYVGSVSPGLRRWVAEVLTRVPGVRSTQVGTMAAICAEKLHVTGLEWRQDAQLGWLTNWQYSQRNPHSLLSKLWPEDFAFIQHFFLEVDASEK